MAEYGGDGSNERLVESTEQAPEWVRDDTRFVMVRVFGCELRVNHLVNCVLRVSNALTLSVSCAVVCDALMKMQHNSLQVTLRCLRLRNELDLAAIGSASVAQAQRTQCVCVCV
ncbi:hypothetical protein PAPYR_6579 [Paratrimastix pyriformis]|uniref:Uncharacterized protein n=1 Tax=Paratrimastix pyriformis TaxID=342808 RepID=A0ABQ8UF40_9EUKA|nr:hypothetical protein PAPYR_6579 [Paratrimastix pyriformis]